MASNAYSWWWASHIRTKQSKWLDQCLQDMEEKVTDTLRILQNDGDSFSQRAEMYYRKRPELVEFVEEAFRAYRALAERYDHLSRELQSANRTIASVFPDQVPCQIDDDEYDESDAGTSTFPSPDLNNQLQKSPANPKVPKVPKKDFRSPSMLLSRKSPMKKISSSPKYVMTTPRSGLTKDAALGEIDKLQKEILALQTEKEFVRSVYERAYEKYWEIEDEITGMQKNVCSLQDEFGVGTVIEDDDARALMAATALKSCQQTLSKLQKIQAQSSIEAKVEYERVRKAHEMFENLRDQFITKFMSEKEHEHDEECKSIMSQEQKNIDEEIANLEQQEDDVVLLREKIKEKLEQDSGNSLTVTEMAECIDELVNKVVTLETAVSSQTGMVNRLRSETDDLQTNVKTLEEDKEMLVAGSEVTNKKLKEIEEELLRVKILNKSVKTQDNSLRTHFTEASCNLEHLSGKLNNMKHDIEDESLVLYKKKKSVSDIDDSVTKDVSATEKNHDDGNTNLDDKTSIMSQNTNFMSDRIEKMAEHDKDDLGDIMSNADIESQDLENGEGAQPNWRHMFVSGLDDREKILLEEYTSVLRNYKDVRVKLNDVEQKNRDSIFELALQLREMKNALVTRDKEIQFLHQKLNCPDSNPDESPYTTTTEYKYTPHEALLRKSGQGSNMQEIDIASLNMDTNAITTPYAADRQHDQNSTNLGLKMTLEKLMAHQDKRQDLSDLEKKFRSDIDDLLEENLEFWLRFSTSVHQIQKFQNSIQDLKGELKTIKENNKSEGHSHSKHHQSMQSQLRPIFRHLREIRTELSLWLEHNAVLQDELQGRYSSLCNIQDEIAKAGNNAVSNNGENSENAEKGEIISGYQAAKFQGEILNMKQENSKVASELQAGLSLVKGMKNDVEKTLDELDQQIGVSSVHSDTKRNSRGNRIPLRSFLFGVKLKRQKHHQSLFACVNPTLSKQNSINDQAPAPI
ncbi:protein NETWORKED 2A-like isoform X3 [Vicia villosa]|uniref:protein NETWORKED 2A-like isoform X3 n=1 Tax=Vicia villosa TaxID=3911 RepID=UPI00273C9C50|nr:protein NETWORKED 2A-like isoform X3 [Vicia villosa]